MNSAESNPVLEALAQSQMAGVHPDADVLAAFAEGGLLSREREALMGHLAHCAECRETLAVAVEATPAPVLAPAVASIDEGLKPQLVPHSLRPSRLSARGWISWTGIAASLLAATTIVLVHREKPVEAPRGQLARQSPEATAVETSPMPVPEPAAAENKLKQLPLKEFSPESKAAPASAGVSDSARATKQAQAEASRPQAELDKALIVAPPVAPAFSSSAAPSVASPAQDALRSRQQTLQSLPSLAQQSLAPALESNAAQVSPSAEVQATPRSARSTSTVSGSVHSFAGSAKAAAGGARSHWRISSEGRVERSDSSGVWRTALPNEAAKMRVVSEFGQQVWAGGDAMRLYRSMDDGLSWTPIMLPAKSGANAAAGQVSGQAPTQSIAHIRCQSATACTVEADDGTSWTTSDNGATWQ